MKKSWLFGIMALTVCQSTLASGFYMGAGVGAIQMKNKLDSSSTVTATHNGEVIASNDSDNFETDRVVNTSLLLGYSHGFHNKAFLALEAFANYAPLKVDNTVVDTYNTVQSTLEFNSVYGLRILPGYQITPKTVAYGIVGFALANSKINSTQVGSYDGEQLSSSYSDSKQLAGYQLGVGAMKHISQHVALRGDVIYTGYQTTSITNTSSEGRLSNTYTLKPYTVEANIALVYQFGS